MKKTTKKLSLGMKIASVLACLAIVSVGFASWWIVQMPDPKEFNTGSFTVYTVDTKNAKIENFSAENTEIIFGTNGTVTEKWLVARDIAPQNLTATFTFDLVLYDNYKDGQQNDPSTTSTIEEFVGDVDFLFSPQYASKLDAAIGAKYIKAPVITYYLDNVKGESKSYTNGDTTLDIPMTGVDANKVTVKVTLEFAWGEAFDEKNPYEFYNDGREATGDSGVKANPEDENNMTWAEHANKALTAIKDLAVTGEGTPEYTIKITANLATAAS